MRGFSLAPGWPCFWCWWWHYCCMRMKKTRIMTMTSFCDEQMINNQWCMRKMNMMLMMMMMMTKTLCFRFKHRSSHRDMMPRHHLQFAQAGGACKSWATYDVPKKSELHKHQLKKSFSRAFEKKVVDVQHEMKKRDGWNVECYSNFSEEDLPSSFDKNVCLDQVGWSMVRCDIWQSPLEKTGMYKSPMVN